jgi:hypothetical protein
LIIIPIGKKKKIKKIVIIVVGRIGLGLGYGAQRGQKKKKLSRIKTIIHPNFNRGPIPWLLNFL